VVVLSEAFALLGAPLWTYWFGLRLIGFYRERGVLKQNYRGKKIAPALGPALLLGYLGAAALLIWAGAAVFALLSVAAVLLGFSFLGLWDDLLEDDTTGFRGHFRIARQGKITAGLLKVITAGLVVLLFAGTLPGPLPQRLPALLLIPLSANGLNLLDRRPGRAIKVFFAGAVLLIFFAPFAALAAALLLPLLAATLAVAPLDLNADGMLGDSGANLLGAGLGVAAVLLLPPAAQLALVTAWVLLHLFCEFHSISRLVDRSPVLRFLDSLGRSREKLS
jgi:UDP-GlcNAc:undecaprenyl-phosphate/decaprenyl-phosphate GlcNAc-1-phosphate transferase